MNDITRRLREADPVGREPGLTPEAVAELRRVVVTAAQEPARASFSTVMLRTVAVAAAAALIVGAGTIAKRRAPAPTVTPGATPAAAPAAAERTQVQFSTPGGTRIVWTIDPSFHIKGHR
jgi:hypothetical protein